MESNIDAVQQFWNARPCNIRHSAKEVGTREYFDEVEKRKYFVEPHIPGFARFEDWSGKDVLEIGCGLGTDAVNFARAGANYHGTELSSASLELAKKRFEVYGLKGDFFVGNAEDLEAFLPPKKFDLIYSFGVIHHTPNPKLIIQGITKFLKPDGEFRCMLYSKYSWKSAMIRLGFDQPEAQYGCPIANTYSFREIRELMEPLKVTELRKDHIFPYVVEKYKRYEYEKKPIFKYLPPPVFRWLEKNFGWHTLITAKLN